MSNPNRSKIINPYTDPSVAFAFWGAPIYEQADGTLTCPGYYGPTFAKNPWDRVLIKNKATPGLATVTLPGGGKKRDVDTKKPIGSNGARNTIHGVDAAKVLISLLIWTPEQLRELGRVWPIYFPLAGKKQPEAFDCGHPLFTLHGIKSLQFVGGDGPFPGPKQGTRVFEMHAVEFQPPDKKKATVTPVQAKGSLLDPPAYPSPAASTRNTDP